MTRMTCLALSVLATMLVAQARPLDGQVESQPASAPATSPGGRFTAVDIYADTGGEPLAAYQFELRATSGEAKIVGIEGGEHPAYKEPPYYDPAALMNNRVILAAFNTGKDLPTGKSRIARVHLQLSGDAQPQYELKLMAAGSPDGQRITIKLSTD